MALTRTIAALVSLDVASFWPSWGPRGTYEGDRAGRVAQGGVVGGSESAVDHAVPVSDSENEEVGVLRGLGQGMVRRAVDDLSVYDDAAFAGCPVRDCRAEESVGSG